MFNMSIFYLINMLGHPSGKQRYGTTNVLLATRTGQQIHNVSSSTRTKVFNGIYTFSNCKCKLYRTSSAYVELTDCAPLTWVIFNQIMEKRCSNGWINNIRSDLTSQRGSSFVNYFWSFWQQCTQYTIIFQHTPVVIHDRFNLFVLY